MQKKQNCYLKTEGMKWKLLRQNGVLLVCFFFKISTFYFSLLEYLILKSKEKPLCKF